MGGFELGDNHVDELAKVVLVVGGHFAMIVG
jgi:hypothetical protein